MIEFSNDKSHSLGEWGNLLLRLLTGVYRLSAMKKVLGYIFSPIHYLFFGFYLVLFHPIQWLSLKLGGYRGHKRSVDILNFFLTSTYYLMGYFIDFINDTYNNTTNTYTGGGATRKEVPIVSKINTNHLATWSYYYTVPANANANIIGGLRLNLGRMQNSTFYDLVNVIPTGSYIKISQL